MKMRSTYKILFLILGFAIPITCFAQLTDTTDADRRGAPRIYKYSARTGALADATVADNKYLSIININPAGLALVEDISIFQVNVSQNLNNNMMLENFTLPALRLGNHSFLAQFGLHHDRGFETFNLLGNNPQPQPKMTIYQMDFVYAFSISNDFSFGVLNNISYSKNIIAQYLTYYPTFGILYSPSRSLSYGLAFRGLGRSATYFIPSPNDGSCLQQDNCLTTFGSQKLRKSLELGASLKLPSENNPANFSVYLANEKRFEEDGLWYKAGLEITRLSNLALRGGILYQSAQNIFAPRFGLGVLTNVIELDYTISHSEELFERYHQLAVTIHI